MNLPCKLGIKTYDNYAYHDCALRMYRETGLLVCVCIIHYAGIFFIIGTVERISMMT